MTQPMLVNVTEEIVHGLVRFLLFGTEYQTFCRCELCEFSIVANVLNKLPSHYVTTTEQREVMFKRLKNQVYINLLNKEIIQAIHEVGKQPNHN